MSIQETDAASRAVAKTDNRISLTFIEGQIKSRWDRSLAYMVGTRVGPSPEMKEMLGHVCVCTLLMRNGFVVIGKSAPMDPENFNAKLGQKFAYEDAIRQLWPLYAFAKLEISLAKRSM